MPASLMQHEDSRRQVLKSTAIVGSAGAFNILAGILRVKVLASLLGPAGVALAGVFQSIMTTAALLAGLGLGGGAVRRIAEAAEEPVKLARIRQALWLGTTLLSAAGGIAVWLLRRPIAEFTLHDATHATSVGWLGVGVFLSIFGGVQMSLLQGLRRIGDMGRVTALGAAAGSLAGIGCVLLLGERGLVAFVIAPPAIAVAVAAYYARHLPRAPAPDLDWNAVADEWRRMLGPGLLYMITSVLVSATMLAVLSILIRELGMDVAGQFQAAWAIAGHYVGFLFTAMVTDFYPRLVQANQRPADANALVNDQIEVGLLLAGPMLLLMIGLSPVVLRLLYSADFVAATELLRWQLAGDLIKLSSWPIGLVLVAQDARRPFLLTQLMWLGLYVGLVMLLLERFGLEAAGIAFVLCYAVDFIANCFIVGRRYGFRLSRTNFNALLALLAASFAVMGLARWSEWAAMAAALLLAGIATWLSLRELLRLLPPGGQAYRMISRLSHWLPGGTRGR